MRVIIAGSRTFNDYDLLFQTCNKALSMQTEIEIVSGKCPNGADKLGERYANEKGYPIKEFPADWSKGKIGGYIRNEEMAKYADALIAFWDEKSNGTKNMIDLAKQYKLKVKVLIYK